MDINSLCCNITQVTIYYFIFIITKIDIDRFVPKSFPKTRRIIAIVAMKENYFDTIVYDNRESFETKLVTFSSINGRKTFKMHRCNLSNFSLVALNPQRVEKVSRVSELD